MDVKLEINHIMLIIKRMKNAMPNKKNNFFIHFKQKTNYLFLNKVKIM